MYTISAAIAVYVCCADDTNKESFGEAGTKVAKNNCSPPCTLQSLHTYFKKATDIFWLSCNLLRLIIHNIGYSKILTNSQMFDWQHNDGSMGEIELKKS